jgi:stearoyl-CoA desaturase (delta-9 desaturase)
MVYVFFATHWLSTVFFQSFFQHRYAAHRMFTMRPRVERVFHLLTYLFQGASFLSPRGYAILHREHHAFSDTKRDPHSPLFHSNAVGMMLKTKHKYDDYAYRRSEPEPRFEGGYPEWDLVDRRLGQSWPMRILWIAGYTAFYVGFATHAWQFLLLPFHFVMGPVHGAIVNWCGHKYGYRSFDNGDASRNSLPLDFLTMGELFQNNHHKWSMSPNFAARRFELDPTWQVMRVLDWAGLIQVTSPQRAMYPEVPGREPVGA